MRKKDIKKDARVAIPTSTKEKQIKTQTRNGYTYINLVIGQKYDKDKKHTTDKRVMIGKVIEDGFMKPNINYYEYFEEERPLLAQPPLKSDALAIATNAVVKEVMVQTSIFDILEEIHHDDADTIIDLVAYNITEQSCVMQHFSDYAFEHNTQNYNGLSDSTLSRFLKENISFQNTQNFLKQWNMKQSKTQNLYVSYDSTNMTTYAEGIDLSEYGHSKDGCDLEQINLSYATSLNDGTPLFYELFPGSIIDNTQLSYAIDLAKEYGYEGLGIILDRGYFSKNNIEYCDRNNLNLVMMVKSNSQVIAKDIKDNRFKLSDDINTYIDRFDVYGLTLKGNLWINDKTQKYKHIFYDNKRASVEKNRFLSNLSSLKKELDKKVEEKINKVENLGRFKKNFLLQFDDYGYLKGYKINNKKLQEESEKFGYFAIITNEEMSAEDALNIYRKRDSTEKSFRALKTHLDMDKYRVHSQQSVEAKAYITFISSIVRNEILERLRRIKGNDKKSFTVPAAISELEKVKAVRNDKGQYVRRYALTSKQSKILNAFNIDDEYIDKVVANI